MMKRPLHTFTVRVTRQSVRPGTGGHISDHTDHTLTVKARNRDAARMAARTELERTEAVAGRSTSFVLTFNSITRQGDRKPWLRLSEAGGPRGASMGRGDMLPVNRADPIKLHLQRIPLNSGGYDAGGAYWGFGSRLYWAIADAETLIAYPYSEPQQGRARVFVRALDREDAKEQIAAEIPGARFYR